MFPIQSTLLVAFMLLASPSEPVSEKPTPQLQSLVQKAVDKKLHEKRFWHLLLRYQESLMGYESEADTPSFFLAEQGKTDPEAELKANIRLLLSPEVPEGHEVHPQCRFPARFRWLWEQLELSNKNVPVFRCPEVIRFLNTMNPSRVSLVFASAFLNAPPSMYGHTFLRFDNAKHPDTLMLSNIINFAANPTTSNPLAYTVLGIFGGFGGRFAGMPYYVKIREYSDMDSRDLWEYEIPLSADQIDWMLRYAWDLDQTEFDYYFFTENCSYHILDLLNIAYPNLGVEEPFPWIAVPFDALHMLREHIPGMKDPVFRPSHTTKMKARRSELTSTEAGIAEQIAIGSSQEDFSTLEKLPAEQQARILDAAHDRFKFLTGFQDRAEAESVEAITARDLAILKKRSELTVQVSDPEIERPSAPHEGHRTARTVLAVGSYENGRMFGEIKHRRALHDVLDRQEGFVSNTDLEMMSFQLRIQPQAFREGKNPVNGVLLERLDLLRVMSLLTISDWVRPPSWRANLYFGRVTDLGCFGWDCTAFSFSGGPGAAFESRLLGKELFYGFVDLHLSAGPAYEKKGRMSASGSLGLLLEPASFWRIHAEASYFVDYPTPEALKFHRLRLKVGTNIAFTSDFALRVEFQQERDIREGIFSFLFYH
jgi:hypothetical protein